VTQQPPNASLSERIERQLAEAGLQVTVESSGGAVVLSGVVDTEEAREAAADIVAQALPDARIDNQIEVETVLPTDVDDFAGDEPTAEMAESATDIRASGELDPDFTDQPVLRDPLAAAGPSSSEADDEVAGGGEVYTPPDDPVVTTDAHGMARVLGGFGTEEDEPEVDVSSDGRRGDEALAEAVRRELAEDAATTDLQIVVAVRNGVAHLRGQVADLDDADNAEAVASRVPGIREVVEELDVSNV
jgi:osmotically-inducible protein OsmY